MYIVNEYELHCPEYQYKEYFPTKKEAQERMQQLYEDVAYIENQDAIERAEIKNNSAFVLINDGNVIEWNISSCENIGTHDSITGERPIWYCWPLNLFARTQSKNIEEQLEHGCTLFDLRAKKHRGIWRGAHGWWYTQKSIDSVLEQIDSYIARTNRKICVHLTYEGKTKNATEFVEQAKIWRDKYSNIVWGPICSKYGQDTKGLKVKYDILIPADLDAWGGKQYFLPLDGKHWQTYIPIPWLWKQFYFRNPEFSKNEYRFVDFL